MDQNFELLFKQPLSKIFCDRVRMNLVTDQHYIP